MGVAENAIGFSPFALSVPIAELADRIEYDHTVHALVAIPYEKNRRSQEHGRIPRRSPGARRTTLNKLRASIRSAVPPEATEGISYGMPAFKYKGSLVAFAAFSNHCSLFPMSLAVMDAFKKELKAFDTTKGTIHFPMDKPLPAALVKKLVKARIAEKDRKK